MPSRSSTSASLRTRYLAVFFLAVCFLAATASPVPTTTAVSVDSATAAAASSSSTSTLTEDATPSVSATPEAERTDGKGYYQAGQSYAGDPLLNQGDEIKPGNDGDSKGSFMSMSLGAQIGIIVAVVVVALSMFGAAVAYYLHRRKAWEKELMRRSTVLQQKASDGNNGTTFPPPPGTSFPPHLGSTVTNGATVTTDVSGKNTVTLSHSQANLPPQTPTWKRWMVKDV